jgi:hypothetical protein
VRDVPTILPPAAGRPQRLGLFGPGTVGFPALFLVLQVKGMGKGLPAPTGLFPSGDQSMSPFLALLDCFRRGPAPRAGRRRPAVECLEDRTLLAGMQLLSSQVSISGSLGGDSQSATADVEPNIAFSDNVPSKQAGYTFTGSGSASGHILGFGDGCSRDPAGGSFSGTATARFQIIPSSTGELPGDEVVLTSDLFVELRVGQLDISYPGDTGEAYSGTQNSTYSASYTLYGQSHDLFSGSKSLTDPATPSGESTPTEWYGDPSGPPILARIGDEIDVSVQFSLNASFDPSFSIPPRVYDPPQDAGGELGGGINLSLTPTLAPYRLCNALPRNGKLENMGSYLSSPDCRFRGMRCKARPTNLW